LTNITGSTTGGVQPLAGSQPSWTANTVMRRMPARKAGTATPTCETAEMASPEGLRWRTAASTPSGMAMIVAITVAVRTSQRVTWSRSATCGAMAAPLT
jgi:hypothetical protein